MASNHIELIGNESRLAGKFRSLVDQTTALQDQMRRMKLTMDEAGATAPADWAAIEALFGFKAGQGALAYDLLRLAAARINAADVDNFVNRIG